MEALQIEEWSLLIDEQTTKRIYEDLPSISSKVHQNFRQVMRDYTADMHMFLERLGVDYTKPFSLQALPVDQGEKVMYSGVFYAYGAVMTGDFEAWDVTLDMFCLSLTAQFDSVPLQMGEAAIEISFEAVLPWILKESM